MGTAEQLTKALQEKAEKMIEPIQLEISIRFRDPELSKIMWLAVYEAVKKKIS